MSTYLTGNPTYLPQIQPFKPNLNLYQGVLQMSQQRYDTNYKQLNSIYSSLLNSPLLRNDTSTMRDEYFKNIDNELKKLANVDLSLSHNTDQAETLFDGLSENKLFLKDLNFTKQYQSQINRANSLRTITDPEKGGGQYWEGGVRELQYKAEEFTMADSDTAMSMSAPKYTSNVDVMGKAMKIAKELDLNIKMDRQQGMYIITEKNGEQAAPVLLSIFQQRLGEDPSVQDFYKSKAYVTRKDFIKANSEQYGSEEAATKEYIRQAGQAINSKMSKTKEELSKRNTLLEEKLNFQKDYHDNEVEMGPSTRDKYYRDLEALQQNRKTEGTVTNIIETNNNNLKLDQLNMMASGIDQTYASLLMHSDFENAAGVLAMVDHEVTMKGDDVAMMYQERQWAVEDRDLKHKWALEAADLKAKRDAKNNITNVLSNAAADANLKITSIDVNKEDLEKGTSDNATSNVLKKIESESASSLKNNRTENISSMMGMLGDEGTYTGPDNPGVVKTRKWINEEIGRAYIEELKSSGAKSEDIRRVKSFIKNNSNNGNSVYEAYGNKLNYNSVKHIHDDVLVDKTGWYFKNKSPELSKKVAAVKEMSEGLSKFRSLKKEIFKESTDGFLKKLPDAQRNILYKHKDVAFDSSGKLKDLNVISTDSAIKDNLSDYGIKKTVKTYSTDRGTTHITSDGKEFFIPAGDQTRGKKHKEAIDYQRNLMLNSDVKVGDKNYKLKDIVDPSTGLLKKQYRSKNLKFKDHNINVSVKNNKSYFRKAFDYNDADDDSDLDFSNVNFGAAVSTNNTTTKNTKESGSKEVTNNLNELLTQSLDEGVKNLQSKNRNKYNVIDDLFGLGSSETSKIAFTLKAEHLNPTSENHQYYQGVIQYLEDFDKSLKNDSGKMNLDRKGLKSDVKTETIYRDLLNSDKLKNTDIEFLTSYSGDKSKQVLRIKVPKELLKSYQQTGEDKEDLPSTTYLDLVIPDKNATNTFHRTTKMDLSTLMFDVKGVVENDQNYHDYVKASASKKGDQYEIKYKLNSINPDGSYKMGTDGKPQYVYMRDYLPVSDYTVNDVEKIINNMSQEYYQSVQLNKE